MDERFSLLSIEEMKVELKCLADSIYTSEIGGPGYFIVTAAEHGAFIGKS